VKDKINSGDFIC